MWTENPYELIAYEQNFEKHHTNTHTRHAHTYTENWSPFRDGISQDKQVSDLEIRSTKMYKKISEKD